MSADVIYDWQSSRRLDDWKLEGHGELLADADGSLHVRTFNLGPLKRATNAWLREVELPDDFEVIWTYRNGSQTGRVINGEGVMIVFNALPLRLTDLWEDTRPEARYSALHSYGKLVCYTCGFFRGPYGGASQLRKLGGHVPATWGESNPVGEDGRSFGELTILSKQDEPLTADDAGKECRYRLTHVGGRIGLWCNDEPVHDFTDAGQYPYYPDRLVGGKMAFREFNGYMDAQYSQITVRRL